MFRVDATMRATSPFTRLVSEDLEDYRCLQVVGTAPVWILDVMPTESDVPCAPLRFMFVDLLETVSIGLEDRWAERDLHLLAPLAATLGQPTELERVQEVWE